MPLIDPEIRSAYSGVRPAPYPHQLASLLQPPQIVVVVTLGEQGMGELDVVHGDTSSEQGSAAEPACTTSVDNFSPACSPPRRVHVGGSCHSASVRWTPRYLQRAHRPSN